MKTLSWRWPFGLARETTNSQPLPEAKTSPEVGGRVRVLPKPAIRWIGEQKTIALRSFDWQSDVDCICEWQRETYALNFPDFRFTTDFQAAFKHDLRRATLDSNHGLFVLDDSPSGGTTCGFLWAVLCLNNWTNERYGYINNLYIAPDKRGLHLGEELLTQAEAWFKARRVRKLRLTVTASNQSACRLYQRGGYQIERYEMEKNIE